MFRKVAAFELRYQLGSPVFWVSFAIFFLLAFAAMTNSHVHIGSPGNTNYNAPIAIIRTCFVMTIFSLFAISAFVANVVVRDDETGFGQIIRTTPVSKANYLFGRFTGAFIASMVVFAAVPIGTLVGTAMPWVDPVKLGPFHAQDYLYAYFVMAMPSLLVLSAALFALATATRSMMATYLGLVGFLVAFVVLLNLFDQPEYEHVVALSEPFGVGALGEATKYWTSADRNTLLPPLYGIVLTNRLIWLGVAAAMLALAYSLFRFEGKGVKTAKKEAVEAAPAPRPSGPLPAPRYDSHSTRTAAWKWTRFEMAQVFRSPAFFVLLLLGLFNAVGAMWESDQVMDFTIFPVTRIMIQALMGAFAIIPIIIAIYYAGELVWRERQRRMHEIFDACPVADWVFVLPKIAAIMLVLIATCLISILAALAVQTFKGYHDYEIGHYLLWYLVPMTIATFQIAALSVFVQALSPQKYFGWMVMGLYVVALIYLPSLGYQDYLYIYGGGPQTPLSDMNGMGKFWIGETWFNVYWTAAALVLTVLAYALWRRGAETRLKPRFARLPRRLRGPAGALLASALIIFAGSGAYIYYNTHVLNEFRTTNGEEDYQADYEKTLLPFEKVPQPRITDVTLNVAVYPHDPRVETNGEYVVQNRTGKPLDRIHLRWARDLKMVKLDVEGARKVKDYGKFAYVIYAFDKPMQPDEKRVIRFTTVWEQKGFKNNGNMTRIVDNGTFVDNMEIAPGLGMDRGYGLLSDPTVRRRHHLPSELRPAKLEDDSARANQYLRHDSDWVMSDITVSTVADQTPIAPGYKVSEDVKDGRRIVRFKSDSPIMNFFSIQSARYAVKHDKWQNVDLAVYYDPKHPYEVGRMIAAGKASLDIYTKAFSPFQFHQLRILEFPAYATFAQSFANTIPYAEGIGFIQDFKRVQADPDRIDLVTYVTAHEIGHQWWAHQIIGADMQGDTLLSETFAQYSAMLVMEKLYGPEHVRKFLKWQLDRYLRARGSEEVEELPLARVENQPYIHYFKGAVVMYRLKQAVGEEAIDRAMRRMLAQYAFKAAPYPKSTDFLTMLRQEAGPQHDKLITDLFEKITIYDLRTNGVKAVKRPDGKYDVALDVEAHKYYADGKGRETETAMAEDVDLGAFLAEPGKKGFDKSKILSLGRHAVTSGKHTLHIVTDKAPTFAGIDPFNEWIDRNSDDNVKPVGK
jgi:aminopeptidase N